MKSRLLGIQCIHTSGLSASAFNCPFWWHFYIWKTCVQWLLEDKNELWTYSMFCYNSTCARRTALPNQMPFKPTVLFYCCCKLKMNGFPLAVLKNICLVIISTSQTRDTILKWFEKMKCERDSCTRTMAQSSAISIYINKFTRKLWCNCTFYLQLICAEKPRNVVVWSSSIYCCSGIPIKLHFFLFMLSNNLVC